MGRPAVLRVDIVADAKGVGKGVSEADRGFGKLGAGAAKLGKIAAVGVAAVGAAVIGIATAAVGAASDLEQSVGAVESVFGKASGTVEKFASDSATRLGLAGAEYRNLATVVGSQLRGMGRSQAAAAVESDKLIGMGADLAATFGGSVSDAVGAVGSLLRGERDPIERYGVSITAADVQARLASKGLGDLTGSSLKQAQATATLELLSLKTAGAHGAFARESNTLAGQQERLKAQFTDVKATIGTALLPALTGLFSWFSTKVLPATKQLGAELGAKLGPTMRLVGGFITKTLVPAGQQLYAWFVTKIAPGIRSAVTPVINGLRQAFDTVRAAIARNEPQLRTIGNALRTVAEFIASKVAPVVGKVLGLAFKGMGDAIGITLDIIGRLVTAFQNAYEWVGRLIDRLRDSAVGKALGKLAAAFTTPYQDARAAVHTIGGPALAGPSAGLSGGARFSWSPAAGMAALTGLAATSAGAVYVDRRTYVQVDGALDPVGVADQLRTILGKADRRDGR